MVKTEPVLESSPNNITRNFTALIQFNQNRKPQYIGRCKLKIDLLSKCLFVEPKNKRFNDISAIFEWKFIRLKNILFVFANLNVQDFVLVFKNEEICNQVCNEIFKNRDVDSVENELLKERFLNSLFKNAPQNSRMKEILKEWIQKFNEKEKNEYLKVLKWHQQNPEISDGKTDIKDVKSEIEPMPKKNRKRRHNEIGNNDISHSLNVAESHIDGCIDKSHDPSSKIRNIFSSDQFKKIIDNSKFKFVNFKTGKRFRRKLLIFTSSVKTECYEFKLHPGKQYFYHRCCENFKGIKAIFDVDENGNECIKMEDKKHRCSPFLYEAEKYIELKIIKKPDYKILENCAAKSKSKRMLIIFDTDDRNLCYEYSWSSSRKLFCCLGCASIIQRCTTAEVFHENAGDEFILFSNEEHVCETRKYNPEKYFSSNQFVTSPNFEIQTKIRDGIERKTLIIFHGSDRKFCYAYYWSNNENRFYCNGCRRINQKHVSAKICKNDDNEEYVILSNIQHFCLPRIYVPQNEIVILHPPKFKFIETTEKFTSKLIIFDSTDSTLCHIFSQQEGGKRYHCLGCILMTQKKNKMNENNNPQTKQAVSVYLQKADEPNYEYFVKINAGEKHICQPKKYDSAKYEVKILKPTIDYIVCREERKYGNVYLVIYYSDDKELCYKYSLKTYSKCFQCSGCSKKNSCLTAKIHQDSKGNEYLTTSEKKHVCAPLKYSSIIKLDTVILEKSGLVFEESKKKKTEKIDENRVIRCANFELQRNSKGVPESRLIIFFNDDQKLCYDYKYQKTKNNFTCKKCNVSAKLQIDKENGNEKFVVLSEHKHKCEPVKYVPEKKLIESNESENGTSNFMVFNRDDENKPKKLVIFTSSTNEMCYEYSYSNHFKTFQCCGCKVLKKLMSARLLKGPDDGKEYIQFFKNDHVCSPKKFILEEFQPKVVSENDFKLYSSKNGKPNARLILSNSEKERLFYEYSLTQNNIYICLQCRCNNTFVSAKLFEKEHGEKYLKLSSTKHVCKLRKSKASENFVVHYNDSGVRNSRLTVFNDDDKSLGHQYSFFKSNNLHRCIGCTTKKKMSSAKLITDKNGNNSLEFGKTGHVCTLRNLKEEKLYFDDFKFEENGKTLITKDPTQINCRFKFVFNEKLGTFCCVKCLEKKKKYITATICKENDEKEFVLLNVAHCCTSVLK